MYLKKDKSRVKNIIVNHVPYQCCPVCNGTGRILADGFTNTVTQPCKVCNGAMIIPMHVVGSTKF